MKKLESLILDYYQKNKHKLINEYKWKVDKSKIPSIILLNNDDQNFRLNLELKKQLTSKFGISNKKIKNELIHYYIYHWGGIHSNHKKTLKKYYNSNPKDLICLGHKGIASWSKALTVHDYNKYAIFDARVSAALNCIQINNNEAFLFPILPSRNNKIKCFNNKIKYIAKERKWTVVPRNQFYRNYLRLLNNVSKKADVTIAHIEMCLFAFAEDIHPEKIDLFKNN